MNWLEISALYTAHEQERCNLRKSKNPLDNGFGWWVMIGGIILALARFIF
jgi:hypothetical protein